MITKVTTHNSPNEQLIFERSQPGRAGFSLPPLDVDETPLEEMIPRELQRDDASQADVLGPIDHAHATGAQLVEDAVVRDGLTDHVVGKKQLTRRE